MSETAVLVSDNPIVKELLGILHENNMEAQHSDLSQIAAYVDSMEKQLNTVLGELNSVRQQLDEIKDKQHPVKAACTKMLNTLTANVEETKLRLDIVKISIIDAAKTAVDAFKEKGISALNAVMNFTKVKSGLDAVRNSVDKSISSTEKSIAKIETMSSELHAIGSHTRNIGRTIVGKETQDDVKENGKIMKIAQLPFKVNKAAMSGIKKVASAAINKLEQLDQTVQQNREKAALKEKKPSILESIKSFKPPAKETADVVGEKSKKQEAAL